MADRTTGMLAFWNDFGSHCPLRRIRAHAKCHENVGGIRDMKTDAVYSASRIG